MLLKFKSMIIGVKVQFWGMKRAIFRAGKSYFTENSC